jgi:transcriptional regulator with XRE-family HTH domain
MSEKFGARLREQREAQKISLDTVARQTKIKLTLLEAMEHDDVSAWPGGLFRRAFVRAYAQAVGLEPERAVREFLADFPDRIVRDRWTGSNGSESRADRKRDAKADATLETGPETKPETKSDARVAAKADTSTDTNIDTKTDAEPMEASVIQADTVVSADVLDDAIISPAVVNQAAACAEASVASSAPLRPGRVPDLDAIAGLCTELGRVEHAEDVEPLLEKFARILEAKGVIVWVWDEPADALRPAVVHGYPDYVVARLPAVTRDAHNPTAEVFRTARTCTIHGRGDSTGGLVVPLLAPAGCIGALGIEFERGAEPASHAGAVATIVAAFLSQLVGGQTTGEAAAHASSRESA